MRTPIRAAALAGILTLTLTLGGFGCRGADKEVLQRSQPVTLKYWRVFDGDDAFETGFAAFRALHPNISIEYRRFRYEEYEEAVLKALAAGEGPDIISLQNTWMRDWQTKLLSAPAVLSLPFREMQGTVKKEAVTVIRTEAGPSPRSVQNDFVDAVYGDVVIPTEQEDPRQPLVDEVYGLPLSVDTLALFYNRDILNRAGIAQPASEWRAFQEQVKTITRLDETGAIIQSGAALGTGANIERSADILSLLMLQNGAQMTDANGTVTFDKYPAELAGRPHPPGAEALIFYTDFANPEKEVYTWNDKMPNSLQAFVNGQTAYFFGYAYHLPQIRQLKPELNFGVSQFPQIADNKPVTFANYWVETVSKVTRHPDEAWGLVQFLASADRAKQYLAVTKKPTALRSLVNGQLEDNDLSVFAAQVPAAKSWYHGNDANATEAAFREMIRQMLAGEADPKRIVELGATKVNQTVR